MKPVESGSDQTSSKTTMNSPKDQKKDEKEPAASTSKTLTLNNPNSPEVKDDLFEPTVDMLVNDFDEEQTLEEEEALAAKDGHDPGVELSDLQRESEMPLEELLKLYGCGSAPSTSTSTSSASTSRKRRKRHEEKSPQPPKQSKKQEVITEVTENVQQTATPTTTKAVVEEGTVDDSPDEDTATTTTNNMENTSLNDDETNCEEEEMEEPSELKKLYNADGELKLDATFSDEEDLDYVPEEEEGKKTIMVGADYQALIPEGLLKYDDALPYENEDKLMWDPSKICDNTLEEYLNKFSSSSNGAPSSTGKKYSRDDEQALLLLLQCGNNCEEAIRRRRLGAMQPTNTMSIWSEEESLNFENGIKIFGKCFHEIQSSKVKTRSVGELVEFYYLWKKTERADLFANKARLDKKKYTINPNVTDLMEKYLEEYDGSKSERDRSASPNINSLLHTDMKRSHRSDTSGINNATKQSVTQQQNALPNNQKEEDKSGDQK